MNGFALGASFLGTFVEFVEALTIVLAVGLTKGWRTAFWGGGLAVAVLAVLTGVVGYPFVRAVRLAVVQFAVGAMMLLFGMRWLRKAVLRFSGHRALHDEGKAFAAEMERQRRSGGNVHSGVDGFGAVTAFNGVFLEGLESVFIVITVGSAAQGIGSAIAGALVALAAVAVLGVAFRKPLQSVPENALKFVVGVMLSAFGTFWTGESFGIHWWNRDASLPLIALFYLAAAWLYGLILKQQRRGSASGAAMRPSRKA